MGRRTLSLRQLDWMLFASVVLLSLFGLVMLYSLTLNVANPDVASFHQQILFAVVSIVVFFFAMLLDYRYYRSYGWVLFAVGVVALLGVLFFGTEIRSAKSWFVLGSLTFQPVELGKVLLILFFAKYFSDHARDLTRFRHLAVSGAGTAVYLILVMLQPDFGSALILLGLFLAVAIFVNVRRLHLVLLLLILIIVSVIAWEFMLQDYHRSRILAVVSPSHVSLQQRYNVEQATVAVGSGRLFGRGLGLGTQSQLNFLPEQKTDFIFAVVAEELGFMGAAALLGLYGFLFFRLYKIATRCRDEFGVYIVVGVGAAIFIQMGMNIGMNLGLFPVAGVPLPFVSYGGSSLLSLFLAIGIVESVVIRNAGRTAAMKESS
ncbi:MAG: rod shape-determining protein RodA [Candidatus Kerfeldbacteria bacterium]|nr:rod shape-determining protein RodA [Candidatus Kerfeldbacteria bacterium]